MNLKSTTTPTLLLAFSLLYLVYSASCQTLIGDPCQNSTECVAYSDSNCPEVAPRVCTCKSAFVPSSDNSTCLVKRYQLDEECLESQQCLVANSDCVGEEDGAMKTCKCVGNYISPPWANNDRCYKSDALVGAPCDDNSDCGIEHASCEGEEDDDGAKACSCKESHVESEDKRKCLEKSGELGMPCEETVQCIDAIENSACLEVGEEGTNTTMTCQCLPEYIAHPEDKTKCHKRAMLIGHPCNDHESQCTIEHATCQEREEEEGKACLCEDTHVGSEDDTRCLAIADQLEAPCEEDAQCTFAVENSACLEAATGGNKTCQCEPEFIPPPEDKSQCNPLAQKLGDSCNAHENQCGSLEGASCQGENAKICVCPAATHIPSKDNNKRCLLKANELGKPCEEEVQCVSLEWSSCKEGADGSKTCECWATHSETADRSNCIENGSNNNNNAAQLSAFVVVLCAMSVQTF